MENQHKGSQPEKLELDIDPGLVMSHALKSFTTLAQIEALEAELLSNPNNVPVPVSHAFCKGVYARTVVIPAGSIAIGHSHTDECLNIVVAGSVSVVIDGEVRKISAPSTFISPPHARKIGYVHEPLTWVTVHSVNHHDVNKLEEELLEKSETFKRYEKSTELTVCKVDEYMEDRVDYLKLVEESGLSAQQIKEMVENTKDQVVYPCDCTSVRSSKIHGNGIFSEFDADPGEAIGVASMYGKRTQIGRYTNHSCYPNARMITQKNGSISLVAIRKISAKEEITVNYRQSFEAAREAAAILKTLTI